MPEPASTADFEVVQPERQPHRTGRPLRLDARRFIRICHHIEEGQAAMTACRREAVTYRLFRMHVTRSPKYQRRLKQAEEVREQFLREFHIANIVRHASTSVSASMFWLERRYPNEFALRTVNRQINSHEMVLDRVTPEQLIEDIRLAQQVANERVQLPSPAPASDG
jgi:hypothetical protein